MKSSYLLLSKSSCLILIFIILTTGPLTGCSNKGEVVNPKKPKTNGEGPQLTSGEVVLSVVQKNTNAYSVSFKYLGNKFILMGGDYPISLEVHGDSLKGYYNTVISSGNALICKGKIKSSQGTVFSVKDIYSAEDNNSFIINRHLKIIKANQGDGFFNSYFGIEPSDNSSLKEYQFFAPGIWYKNNNHMKPGSLARNYRDHYFYFREDRMPLPVIMLRQKDSGITISLTRLNADPKTFKGDKGGDRVVSGKMKFGSLGIRQLYKKTAVVFCYPGSEGKTTYFGGSWARRSHPVKEGFTQTYKLQLKFSKTSNFPTALKETWREAYNHYNPSIYNVNMKDVYNGIINIFSDYWKNLHHAAGLPFSVYLSNGVPAAYNYEMGFASMQLPDAYFLIRAGLEKNNKELINKGVLMVNFWAKYSPTPNGLPKTWADAYPDKPATWRGYPTYMRVVGDGMEGALHAWSVMKKHGINKPKWLKFCKDFGDWLVQNQNPYGSYFRGYDWHTGKPIEYSKFTTTNVIRFLVELYYATNNRQYLNAALKAGRFSYHLIHQNYLYVGSVIDNPNVKDRESGQQAMNAFLALYDVTSNKKWLRAAVQAGYYTATFMYSYNISMIPTDTRTFFSNNTKTTGQTLIATGHSGADMGMSWSSFQYFRLYLFTGDKFFLNISKMCMYNTLQTMDLNGSYGYAYKVMQPEAFSLVASSRGHGVDEWLPWMAAAVMDPLNRFKDAFGKMSIKKLMNISKSQLMKMNNEYSKTRGIYRKH